MTIEREEGLPPAKVLYQELLPTIVLHALLGLRLCFHARLDLGLCLHAQLGLHFCFQRGCRCQLLRSAPLHHLAGLA